MNNQIEPHTVIDYGVSHSIVSRPQALQALASVYGTGKEYASKWTRPYQDGGTGEPSPLTRVLWLIDYFDEYCPAASEMVEMCIISYRKAKSMGSKIGKVFDRMAYIAEMMTLLSSLARSENDAAVLAQISAATKTAQLDAMQMQPLPAAEIMTPRRFQLRDQRGYDKFASR